MEIVSVLVVFLILIIVGFVIIIAIVRDMRENFYNFEGQFGYNPTLLSLGLPSQELQELEEKLSECDAFQKLQMLRSILGYNYRAFIRVAGNSIYIESVGEDTFEEHSRKNFG